MTERSVCQIESLFIFLIYLSMIESLFIFLIYLSVYQIRLT
jgi:hypothetical protein